MPSQRNQFPSQATSYFEIRKLVKNDVEHVSQLFREIVDSKLDITFHPHSFDIKTAIKICTYTGLDLYVGCFKINAQDARMVGYVLLRGWDEGFKTPSLGICILKDYQGLGLGKSGLDLAVCTAKLRRCQSIRLKTYPNNYKALSLFIRSGFTFSGELEDGQLVGYLSL